MENQNNPSNLDDSIQRIIDDKPSQYTIEVGPQETTEQYCLNLEYMAKKSLSLALGVASLTGTLIGYKLDMDFLKIAGPIGIGITALNSIYNHATMRKRYDAAGNNNTKGI